MPLFDDMTELSFSWISPHSSLSYSGIVCEKVSQGAQGLMKEVSACVVAFPSLSSPPPPSPEH
jgi:hypothetical protein